MNQTKEKHDQYYEMAHSPISHIIPKLAAPTIVSMLISSIYNGEKVSGGNLRCT